MNKPKISEIQSIARLKIHDGNLDEFKRLSAKCPELVRTKDTETLQHETYFNSDETECLVFECYHDSQALLDHLKNMEETGAAIFRTCTGSGEVCRTPSLELTKALDGSPVRSLWHFSIQQTYRMEKNCRKMKWGFQRPLCSQQPSVSLH